MLVSKMILALWEGISGKSDMSYVSQQNGPGSVYGKGSLANQWCWICLGGVLDMSEWHVPLTGGKEFIHPNAVTMSLLNVRMFTSIFIVLRSHRASFPPSPLGSLVDRQDAKVIVAGQVDR